MKRNEKVEHAVGLLLELIDMLSGGNTLGPPPEKMVKAIFDEHVQNQGGSVRLACAFLAAYSVVDEDWDFKSVPTGIRGKYGDKRIASELTLRHVTFHRNITAFGENLGWKGAVKQFDLSTDLRFAPFVKELERLDLSTRTLLVKHIAWRLHDSRVIPRALPRLPTGYLSYAKSLDLCEQLMAIPSEGHVQQFLVAAFLEVHRRRLGHRITTHHPHASDKYDRTTGDIEEFRDDALVAAYEVTVRNDWKNRLPDFREKALRGNLQKYIIFASGVRSDIDIYPAERLVNFLEDLSFDLAVVDLSDFFNVFCAELSQEEIRIAINKSYQMLADPRLSGRQDFLIKYQEVTDEWLDNL